MSRSAPGPSSSRGSASPALGLIIDNPAGFGLSTRVGPTSDEAYFVVHHACAAVTLSIAHEIGHILGVRHDRFVDDNDTPFVYGHGWVNGDKWRDIMSYKAGGGLPAHPLLVEPAHPLQGRADGHPRGRQRPRHPRARRARIGLPLVDC